MKNATTAVTTPKPEKPWPDFPLYWHSRGYWMKKHRGRELRFTADANKSYEMWRDVLDRERRGERAVSRKRFLLRDAINLYLTRQLRRFKDGELSDVQFTKCRFELETMLPKAIPLSTPLDEFNADSPTDPRPGELFARIRTKAKARGLSAMHRHITLIRACLDMAARKHLMRAPDYGDDFDPPVSSLIDKERNAADLEHGERAWTVEQLRTILADAKFNPHRLAQLMLAMFGGFGSDDCSALPETALRRNTGFVVFPRVKNGRPRAVWLPKRAWDAIDASLAKRKPATTDKAKPLVFRTRAGTKCNAATAKSDERGLLSTGRNDTIGKNFTRRLEVLQLTRHRAGFKTLRAMCRTLLVGADVHDDIIKAIMGRPFRQQVDEFYLRGDLRAEMMKAGRHIERKLFPVTRTPQHRPAHRDGGAASRPRAQRRGHRAAN